MILLVQDFAFLSVALRALLLSLQTLTVGGILFLLLVAPGIADIAQWPSILRRCTLWIGRTASALAVIGVLYVASDSAELIFGAGLQLHELPGATYFIAGSITAVLASLIAIAVRRLQAAPRAVLQLLVVLVLSLMVDTVFTSHAVSRLDHRVLLSLLTLLHQGAAASWLGGLAFFVLAIRTPGLEPASARRLLQRFTVVAIGSVVTLIVTGVLLSVFFIGSVQALYGTAYGVMVVSKAIMLLVLLVIGGANFLAGRAAGFGQAAFSLLRRFSELELITAFTVILLAASLTSQPPGVDLVDGRLTLPEIAEYMHPQPPLLLHPPLEAMSPATPLDEAARNPDDLERIRAHTEGDADRAMDTFEHNWAGIFILFIATLAMISNFRWGRWARFWPLSFIVMSIFLMIFADTENWPLGPIGYWQSFVDPEVALHRIALSLLIVFAIFETGVQTGRLRQRFALVFPLIAVAATSAFLLHSHSLGNVRRELLLEMTHTPISILGFMFGMFRLTELSLRKDLAALAPAQLEAGETLRLRRTIRFASLAWPACLFLAGLILVGYHQS